MPAGTSSTAGPAATTAGIAAGPGQDRAVPGRAARGQDAGRGPGPRRARRPGPGSGRRRPGRPRRRCCSAGAPTSTRATCCPTARTSAARARRYGSGTLASSRLHLCDRVEPGTGRPRLPGGSARGRRRAGRRRRSASGARRRSGPPPRRPARAATARTRWISRRTSASAAGPGATRRRRRRSARRGRRRRRRAMVSTRPIAMPGDAGSGAPLARPAGAGCGSSTGSGSSKRRSASATTWSTASRAWLPVAVTSTRWPHSAPSVATRDRLVAGTGPGAGVEVAQLDAGVVQPGLLDQPRGRAGVQAVPVGDLHDRGLDVRTARRSATSGGRRLGRRAGPGADVGLLRRERPDGLGRDLGRPRRRPPRRPRRRRGPRRAAPGTAPSARGRRGRPCRAPSRPRARRCRGPSARRRPSPSSAAVIASTIAVASVPNVVASRPAATAIRTLLPCSISEASATAASARARLCETTTSPVMAGRPRPACRAAAATSSAADVAPGSWWPTLRSPRYDARPLRASIGMVASRPASAAAAARASASARPAPSASAASSASQAGASASYIVLSPACALPRATTPSSPARSAAANAGGVEAVGVAGAAGHPQEERAVERAAGAADRADQRHPGRLEQRARRGASASREGATRQRSSRGRGWRRGRRRRSRSRAG